MFMTYNPRLTGLQLCKVGWTVIDSEKQLKDIKIHLTILHLRK